MASLTLDIPDISATLLDKIDEKAKVAGRDSRAYILELIEKDAAIPVSFLDVFATVREDFKNSEMTLEELDSLIDEIREEVHQDKQAKHSYRSQLLIHRGLREVI